MSAPGTRLLAPCSTREGSSSGFSSLRCFECHAPTDPQPLNPKPLNPSRNPKPPGLSECECQNPKPRLGSLVRTARKSLARPEGLCRSLTYPGFVLILKTLAQLMRVMRVFRIPLLGIPAMTMELMLLETAAALLNRKVPIIMAPHSTSCWWALRGMARVRWAIFS